MNVLLIYRSSRYEKEIIPQIVKYRGNNIYLIVEGVEHQYFMTHLLRDEHHIMIHTIDDLISGKIDNIQYDYIVGNPPYKIIVNDTDKYRGKPHHWATIVTKCFSILKDGGEMSMIHPSGWRFTMPQSLRDVLAVENIYRTNTILKLELYDMKDGKQIFGARTDYDIIIIRKEASLNNNVIIRTKSDNECLVDLRDYDLIPTNEFQLLNKLNASNGEERVDLIHSYSAYDVRCSRLSKNQDDVFKYPVIYTMSNVGIKLRYSNTKENGHYGIPKLIIRQASSIALLDLDGKYAMSQFAAAITDTVDNLIKMKSVLESEQFKILKDHFTGDGGNNKGAIIDSNGTMFKFIRQFKKDFWKEINIEPMGDNI